MSINTVRIVGVVAGLLISVAPLRGQFAPVTPESSATESMRFSPDVADVVKMVQAGKPQDEVITLIKTCPRLYSLSATDAVNLDKFKVPPQVVLAMVEHDRALAQQEFTPAPGVTQKARTAPAVTGAPAAGKAAKSVQPANKSDVSRPKGNPPETLGQPKKTWTSSVIVEKAPPAPKLELVPKEPGTGYVWIRGHWAWKDGIWAWEQGYWVQRPAPDIQWMDGLWSRHGKGWIWIPGHWR
jgi:hypothetical protein